MIEKLEKPDANLYFDDLSQVMKDQNQKGFIMGGYNQIQIDTKNDGETLVIKEGSRFEANGELYFVSEEDTEIEITVEMAQAWEDNEYSLYKGYLYIAESGELTLDDTSPTYNPVLSGHYNGFNRALAQIQHESGAVRYKLLDSPMIPDWGDWIGDFTPYVVFEATSGSGSVELEKGLYQVEAVGGGGGGGGGGVPAAGVLGGAGGSGGNCAVFSYNISVGGAGGGYAGGGGGGGYMKIDVFLLEKPNLLYTVGAGGAGGAGGAAGGNPGVKGNNGGYTFVYEKFKKIHTQTNGNTGGNGSGTTGGAGGAGFLGAGAGGNGGNAGNPGAPGAPGQNGLIRITKIG